MKTTIRIISEETRRRAVTIIAALPADGSQEIVVREYKDKRSEAQRGLYWIWITHIAGETGEPKIDVHRRMKKTHLIPIYMADPDSGMAETVATIREVHAQGMKKQAKLLADKVVDLVSTNDADVKQFTEYLNEIERESISRGIYLVHPEDIWREAMGN